MANCPPRESIIIENDHYTAYDRYGFKWTDVNPTYGHKLPAVEFWRAMGVKKGNVGAFATHFSCAYTTSDGYAFGLVAPWDQIYKLDESPYWELDKNHNIYFCIYKNKESDCPFKPYS